MAASGDDRCWRRATYTSLSVNTYTTRYASTLILTSKHKNYNQKVPWNIFQTVKRVWWIWQNSFRNVPNISSKLTSYYRQNLKPSTGIKSTHQHTYISCTNYFEMKPHSWPASSYFRCQAANEGACSEASVVRWRKNGPETSTSLCSTSSNVRGSRSGKEGSSACLTSWWWGQVGCSIRWGCGGLGLVM